MTAAPESPSMIAGWLAQTIDLLEEGLLALDGHGRVRQANPAAGRLFGRDARELIGLPAADLLPPDLMAELTAAVGVSPAPDAAPVILRAMTRFGALSREITLPGVRSAAGTEAGAAAIVRLRGYLIAADDSDAPCALLFLRDISAQRAREQALQRSQMQAEAMARARWDFLATMSHELRTPLSAIMAYSDSMLSGLVGFMHNPTMERYLQLIHRSGQHMMELTNDFLDFSKLEADKVTLYEEDVDLKGVIEDAVGMIEGQAEEGGVIATAAESIPRVFVYGDRLRLSQILVNLLSNAVKFTPSGGSVLVDLVRTPDTGDVVVVVRDTGIGIPAADLHRVFEPFAQVARPYRGVPGTGLGLPLTKKLVEMHGGTLSLSSEPGAGTTARVILPAVRVVKGRGTW